MAMEIGIDIHTFEYVTPHELQIIASGKNKRDEYTLYLTWLSASLSKAKKVPKFKELLPKKNKVIDISNRNKMSDIEIEIHHNRFKSERRLLLIG